MNTCAQHFRFPFGDQVGFVQLFDQPFGRLLIDRVGDRCHQVFDDLAMSRQLDALDADESSTAAFAFYQITFFQRETRLDDVIDLRRHALELLRQFIAPDFYNLIRAVQQYTFQVLFDDVCCITQTESPAFLLAVFRHVAVPDTEFRIWTRSFGLVRVHA